MKYSFTLKGPELNYDYISVNLKELNTKEKLTKHLSDFVENPPQEGTSHLVLGNLQTETGDLLKINYLTIEDSDFNEVDYINIKNKNNGDLIKPEKGHAVLLFFYYYDHGIYKMNTNKKINDIYLQTKQFNNEAIIMHDDNPDFEISAEEASGGGDYRYKIIFEDNYFFEGSGNDWIDEVYEHMKSMDILK